MCARYRDKSIVFLCDCFSSPIYLHVSTVYLIFCFITIFIIFKHNLVYLLHTVLHVFLFFVYHNLDTFIIKKKHSLNCETSNSGFVNHDQISSWKQPVLSNMGKVSFPRKQLEPMVGSSSCFIDIYILCMRRDKHCSSNL